MVGCVIDNLEGKSAQAIVGDKAKSIAIDASIQQLRRIRDKLLDLPPDHKIHQCDEIMDSMRETFTQVRTCKDALQELYAPCGTGSSVGNAAAVSVVVTGQIAAAKGGLALARYLLGDRPDPECVKAENKVLDGASFGAAGGALGAAGVGFLCGGPIGALFGAAAGTALGGGLGAAWGATH